MMVFVARIAYWIGYGSRSIASNRRSFTRGVARIKELLEGVPDDVLEARSRVAPRTGLTTPSLVHSQAAGFMLSSQCTYGFMSPKLKTKSSYISPAHNQDTKHRAKEQYVFFLNTVMMLLTLHSTS